MQNFYAKGTLTEIRKNKKNIAVIHVYQVENFAYLKYSRKMNIGQEKPFLSCETRAL